MLCIRLEMIFISVLQASISHYSSLSPSITRREVPQTNHGQREARREKNNLEAFHSFGALIFCPSLMQDKTTAPVKEKPFAGRKTVAKEVEQHEEEDI